MTRSLAQSTRGVSLLELVVVLALFGTIAAMGTGILRQLARSESTILRADDEVRRLAYGLALLRSDLSQAMPVTFHPPGTLPLPEPEAKEDGIQFSLCVSGQPTLDGTGPRLARVTWRLEKTSGVVTRQSWPCFFAKVSGARGPEVPVFDRVAAMTLETYAAQHGWKTGFAATALSENPTQGLRVMLVHRDFETINTTVSLR